MVMSVKMAAVCSFATTHQWVMGDDPGLPTIAALSICVRCLTELAKSGASDEVIMSIAGHVSRAMLSRYSHVRMEAKRRALDEIAARQWAAEEKLREEAERQEQAVVAPESYVLH
jgi:hypothetical protein